MKFKECDEGDMVFFRVDDPEWDEATASMILKQKEVVGVIMEIDSCTRTVYVRPEHQSKGEWLLPKDLTAVAVQVVHTT